jgi:putative endonuclease
MGYCVYILANQTHTVLYTGVTNDLVRRISEHRREIDSRSFTAKYHVHKLVYYESTPNVLSAIEREKQIKSWSRKRKNALIEQRNPNWEDLYQTIL